MLASGRSIAGVPIAGRAAHIASHEAAAMLAMPHALQPISAFCVMCMPSDATGIAMDVNASPAASSATSRRREISFLAVELRTDRTMVQRPVFRNNQEPALCLLANA